MLEHSASPPHETSNETLVPPTIARRLYVSHFLSTWNSRLFEFGSVLFLAAIYPGTLMPVSIYALVRAAAAIVFSPAIGRIIDRADRLRVVRASIVGERLAIATSCALLLALQSRRDAFAPWAHHGIFAVVVLLAGVEKLCSIMNSVSVSRDWVRRSGVLSVLAALVLTLLMT